MKQSLINQIKKAKKLIKMGSIIIYPTDTAYAIGCKFQNKTGIKKILKIKKRKDTKFTLIASSLAQVRKYFKLNTGQLIIAKKYWPGPVSIVVSPEYSIRVPKCDIARKLARSAGMPVIATSLNISGQSAIYDLQNISVGTGRDLSVQNINIIDIGPLTKRKTSAIIQCLASKKIKIIRHGSIPVKISS